MTTLTRIPHDSRDLVSLSAFVRWRIRRSLLRAAPRPTTPNAESREVSAQWPGQRRAGPQGSSGSVLATAHLYRHIDTCAGQHLDERIDAEPLDFAAREVRDPRLRDVEKLRRFRLRETSGFDETLDLEHEISADTEMLGFDVGE